MLAREEKAAFTWHRNQNGGQTRDRKGGGYNADVKDERERERRSVVVRFDHLRGKYGYWERSVLLH